MEEQKASIEGLVELSGAADVVIHHLVFVAAAAAAHATKTRNVSVQFAPAHKARGYGPTGRNMRADVLFSASHSALLDLIAVSPCVIPKESAWGEATHVCGYWFLEEPEFVPPKNLEAFVLGAEPPIVLGFGSMMGSANSITTKIVEAVDGLRRRIVLMSGWAGLGKIPLPDNVRVTEFVPHG